MAIYGTVASPTAMTSLALPQHWLGLDNKDMGNRDTFERGANFRALMMVVPKCGHRSLAVVQRKRKSWFTPSCDYLVGILVFR